MVKPFLNGPPLDRVRAILHYDPLTGIFTNRIDRVHARNGARVPTSNGQIWIDGRRYRANRVAWLCATGEWPELEVDHKDLDKNNNSFKNLRLATRSQNQANNGAYSNNKLQVKGVRKSERPAKRPYRAKIGFQGRVIHLGYFESPEAAHEAYLAAALRFHGEFARGSKFEPQGRKLQSRGFQRRERVR